MADELWLLSYEPKDASLSHSDTTFGAYFKSNLKTMVWLQQFYTPNNSATTEHALLRVKSANTVTTYNLWPYTNIAISSFACN